MMLIFCADPLDRRCPDPAFAAEVAAARAMGLEYALVSYESLVDGGDPQSAVKNVPACEPPELGIYRGWMLKPDHYRQLFEHLGRKGLSLINTPAAYTHCHYLPESYPIIQAHTPKTVWLHVDAGFAMEKVAGALQTFGARPLILKDFCKSRKHEWEQACYIPSAADLGAVERVVSRFLELQGEDLAGGLVFREFVELELLTRHSKSGMPLAREYRLFFLDGELLCTFEYWEEGAYGDVAPPTQQFAGVAQKVESRFFTMDVARQADGEWIIIELGDAQVAGLPENADAQQFYRALAARLPHVESI